MKSIILSEREANFIISLLEKVEVEHNGCYDPELDKDKREAIELLK
jgi:hypothetical protein